MDDADKPNSLLPMMQASARALGLSLPQGSQEAVLRDMAAILEQARICEESLAEDPELVEIAPVFRP